jgi:hypothetical protein
VALFQPGARARHFVRKSAQPVAAQPRLRDGDGVSVRGSVDERTNITLTDEQRLDWLRLIRSENVGPRGIMAQTPQAIFRRGP